MQIRPVALPDDRRPLLEFLGGMDRSLSENKHSFLALSDGRPGGGWVAEEAGDVVGYVGLAPARPGEWAMEVVARAAALVPLVDRTLAELDKGDARTLRWWVYDADLDKVPLRFGFAPERELLFMARALPGDREPALEGYTVRGFGGGHDEDAWLGVNNAAFAGHPENGDMDRAELTRRMSMGWFDPEGVRMAWIDGRLAGFCWTKIEEEGAGEIYIIAAHPDFQGRGLGSELVREGMRHLSSRGCERVYLYTEGDNRTAIRTYERLGFEVERVHRSFVRSLR